MEKKYCCKNPDCKDNTRPPYVMVLNEESVMDEQNLAQMFCPRCKSRLVTCREEPQTAC